MRSRTITINIPAAVGGVPGIFTLDGAYKVFSCLSTTGTYQVQPQLKDSPTDIDQSGRGFGSPDGETFATLIFSNASAVIITTKIYTGPVALPQSVAISANLSNVITTQQIVKLVAAAGTPVALAAAGVNFVLATILAQPSVAKNAANVGKVYLGAGNGAVNNQPYTLNPGDTIVIEAPPGFTRRFQDWFIDADNNGDGVVIIYS